MTSIRICLFAVLCTKTQFIYHNNKYRNSLTGDAYKRLSLVFFLHIYAYIWDRDCSSASLFLINKLCIIYKHGFKYKTFRRSDKFIHPVMNSTGFSSGRNVFKIVTGFSIFDGSRRENFNFMFIIKLATWLPRAISPSIFR